MTPIETERLSLRQWRRGDLPAARSWHGSERVMRQLGGALGASASDDLVQRWHGEVDALGYGMLAVCRRGEAVPIGSVGLGRPAFECHFTPCDEIGWRFSEDVWGMGYATEAAAAVLRDGFTRVGMQEIVAFTVADHIASQRVMARLGMRRDLGGDFIRHFGSGGPAQPSVLWRAQAADFAPPAGAAAEVSVPMAAAAMHAVN